MNRLQNTNYHFKEFGCDCKCFFLADSMEEEKETPHFDLLAMSDITPQTGLMGILK